MDLLFYQLTTKNDQPFKKDIQPLHIDLIKEALNIMFRASCIVRIQNRFLLLILTILWSKTTGKDNFE